MNIFVVVMTLVFVAGCSHYTPTVTTSDGNINVGNEYGFALPNGFIVSTKADAFYNDGSIAASDIKMFSCPDEAKIYIYRLSEVYHNEDSINGPEFMRGLILKILGQWRPIDHNITLGQHVDEVSFGMIDNRPTALMEFTENGQWHDPCSNRIEGIKKSRNQWVIIRDGYNAPTWLMAPHQVILLWYQAPEDSFATKIGSFEELVQSFHFINGLVPHTKW